MREGLNTAAIHRLQQKYGKNLLTAVNPNPWWKMLFRQFTDLMVVILMVSALIAIAFGIYEAEGHGLIDGLVIFAIVLVNAAIGFFQEFKAEKALEALQKLISPTTVVIRNKQKQQIKAENVVPGDIVVLAAGDKIPADGVMIEAHEIKIDEAPLTGESVPVHKQIKDELSMGTTVVAGAGLMEVTHIGMKTRFGRIAHLTTTTVKDESPLQKELFHIGVFVTKVTLLISGILILTGVFIQGQSFVNSLLFAVSVAVAAVPEGLPATITVALALGVQKMVKKNAVVKRLSSIETLGSTTVICSDKTGTLTQNQMTVTKLLLGTDQVMEVKGSGYNPKAGVISRSSIQNPNGKKTLPLQHKNLEKLREVAQYCAEAVLEKKGSQYRIIGDPTEGALLTLAQKKLEGKKLHIFTPLKIEQELPFDSERKMMSVIIKESKGKQGKYEILTKGAPDELLKRCTKILVNGKIQALSASQKKQVLAQNEAMASQALRMIGFAFRSLPASYKVGMSGKTLEKDLVYIGLAGMIDPPRAAVPKAVGLCHKAGIRTIIITGDNGLTAKAIAKQIGIAHEETPIYNGKAIDAMTDKQLDQILKVVPDPSRTVHELSASQSKLNQSQSKLSPPQQIQRQSLIFSRVNPEHKRRIVDRLKRMGEIVAVTGDGVNDAPALKRADLGIAMGITGTEVSKETANMILLDDSFASIVTAVREGRKIYANLKKFTWFIFSCNIGELVTVFSAIIFQIPAPLTAALILAIDLGTDILPGIALGVDHAEPDVMEKAPRDQKLRIMHKSFVMHFLALGTFIGAIVVGIYFWKLKSLGWSFGDTLTASDPLQQHASSLAFTALVVIQLFNAFNARSFEHSVFSLRSLWPLWGSIVVSVVLVLSILYIPLLQTVFRTTGLSMNDWGIVMAAGLLVLFVEELRKGVMKIGKRVQLRS